MLGRKMPTAPAPQSRMFNHQLRHIKSAPPGDMGDADSLFAYVIDLLSAPKPSVGHAARFFIGEFPMMLFSHARPYTLSRSMFFAITHTIANSTEIIAAPIWHLRGCPLFSAFLNPDFECLCNLNSVTVPVIVSLN